ncbi:MAG: hypothetical protein QXF35_04160 [Candidatus Bilamarchaeaceae archaeon]
MEKAIIGDFIYHIGKVIEVITSKGGIKSADTSVQAVVRMWDENLLILKVEKKIENYIKKGDIVLADYTPISDRSPYRKTTIIKILPAQQGEAIWNEFRIEYEKRREGGVKKQPMPYIR